MINNILCIALEIVVATARPIVWNCLIKSILSIILMMVAVSAIIAGIHAACIA